MMNKARSFFRGVLIIGNLGIIVLYLIVCFTPFVNTGKYWFFALPGLIFPFLFAALAGFIILWLLLRSRWLWVSLVVLLIGFRQIFAVFGFHFPQQFVEQKQANTLRILHWNTKSWDDFLDNDPGEGYLPQMMQLLQNSDADILCFEEYADIENMKSPESVTSTITRMGYPYHVFAATLPNDEPNQRGVIIFSKYPILQSDSFNYGKDAMAEHLIYADVRKDNKTFRVFTTHLQSVRFQYSDYQSLAKLKRARDPGYHKSRNIIAKLKAGYQYRYHQAQVVKQKIAESPYPVIITGDFNDIPNSNTYFTIKGDLQDAFLKKGFFIGRTFRYISPTLRIDYILADKTFKVDQFRTIHVPFSDHYPIEADLHWK